jgi:hypothetical protein
VAHSLRNFDFNVYRAEGSKVSDEQYFLYTFSRAGCEMAAAARKYKPGGRFLIGAKSALKLMH